MSNTLDCMTLLSEMSVWMWCSFQKKIVMKDLKFAQHRWIENDMIDYDSTTLGSFALGYETKEIPKSSDPLGEVILDPK